MSHLGAVALAAAAGLAAAVQSSINATLGKAIGALSAALLTFLVSAVAGGAVILAFGRVDFGGLGSVPPFYWLGGVFGVGIVLAMILAVPRVGLAVATTALVVAQLISAVVIDHFGLFGVPRLPVTPARLAGVALLLVALRFVFR